MAYYDIRLFIIGSLAHLKKIEQVNDYTHCFKAIIGEDVAVTDYHVYHASV